MLSHKGNYKIAGVCIPHEFLYIKSQKGSITGCQRKDTATITCTGIWNSEIGYKFYEIDKRTLSTPLTQGFQCTLQYA